MGISEIYEDIMTCKHGHGAVCQKAELDLGRPCCDDLQRATPKVEAVIIVVI
jgi:hypothetical protein